MDRFGAIAEGQMPDEASVAAIDRNVKRRAWQWWAIGTLGSFGLWTVFFPHTFWFVRFWLGLLTGICAVDVVAQRKRSGSPLARYMADRPYRRSQFAVAVLGTLLGGAELQSEESLLSRVRAVNANEIAAITITDLSRPGIAPSDVAPRSFGEFEHLAHGAKLFYPSHEGSIESFELRVELQNGTRTSYSGRVPERHLEDFSIAARTLFSEQEVLFPSGRKWLRDQMPINQAQPR